MTGAAPSRRFGFVQWELAGRPGPEPGRYVVRRFAGDDARQVLIVGGLQAPRRRRLARRPRPRATPPGDGPATVEVTRVTVVSATAHDDERAARAWLAHATGAGAEAVTGEALALLNRAIHGHRIAAADPYVTELGPAGALVTRVGYGTGEQVAEGEWEVARELPPAAAGRPGRALPPQERLAALLAGRDVPLACEELALRARLDLDQGRQREAALQARVALDVALAELESWREEAGLRARLEELRGRRAAVAAAADAALQGGLEPSAVEAVDGALGRLEAALRARSAAVRQ